MSEYSTINNITTGFFIAVLSSLFLYLDWFGFVNYFINTLFGLLSLYLLLKSDKRVWFWFGVFVSAFWFWWVSISFKNYGFAWAIPIGILLTSIIYGLLFTLLASLAEYLSKKVFLKHEKLFHLIFKAIILLSLSSIHPLGFDWYKPELIFTNSYLGIEKWQFAIVLMAILLSLYTQRIYLLLLVIFAYPYGTHFEETPPVDQSIKVTNFNITVHDKWDPNLQQSHINEVFHKIDEAIAEKRSLIILPESIFALFLNRQPRLMDGLQTRSHQISIVLGSLYMDKETPRNSTYIFTNGSYSIANKVVLVPFGEANPLPAFLGDLMNEIFFDGAPDYFAASKPTDYRIGQKSYRNAICYEACSEELYEGEPETMIVISNNGWVVPSIEPTLQKILLQYYSKKYGTTIYHAINMSPSYIIQKGEMIEIN
ncbi:MAG TPA: apolipoprotein N-acyltransferase [Campylobacterales bacterium]|nr:apolipoprotein N-acyltransferase [Campylobacterales bacterium]